jgi:hypothetical protein
LPGFSLIVFLAGDLVICMNARLWLGCNVESLRMGTPNPYTVETRLCIP